MSREIATERVWRTITGAHVPDGHPAAAFLVAAEGDEIPDEVIIEPVADDSVDGGDHVAKADEPTASRKRGRKPVDADEVDEVD